jgi:short-subunit dehydrogenase
VERRRSDMNEGAIRRALVTGASSGLGAEFARQLAASGTNLILVARRRERLETLAEELGEKNSVAVDVVPADLSKDEDLERIEARIFRTSDLDLLVNNAGFGAGGEFSAGDIGTSLEMIRVQIVAPVRLTRAALGGMLARNRGRIVNVASIAAFSPLSGTTYAAVKGYLLRFTQGLRLELRGTAVRVQALCPGFTHTEFHDKMEKLKTSMPGFLWMSAEDVVRISLRALGRRRAVCVPGRINRFLVLLMRCPPTAALMTAASGLRVVRKRIDD